VLIEKGRYSRPKLPRDLRQCTVCTQIEDEEHFILFCKKHDSIRKNLFYLHWNYQKHIYPSTFGSYIKELLLKVTQ
jgi:hypothetical protein